MSDNEQDYVPVAQTGEFSDESSSENQDEHTLYPESIHQLKNSPFSLPQVANY